MNKYLYAGMIFSKFSKDLLDQLSHLPIRPSEIGLLNVITQRDEKHTPLMLAELLGVSKPMVTAHVSNLERQGYVIREPSPTDGRSFYVIPTEKAFALTKDFNKDQTQRIKEIENELGEDGLDTLVSLMSRAQGVLAKGKKV